MTSAPAGSSFGFESALVAHRTIRYGIVVLTNGENVSALATSIHHQIAGRGVGLFWIGGAALAEPAATSA